MGKGNKKPEKNFLSVRKVKNGFLVSCGADQYGDENEEHVFTTFEQVQEFTYQFFMTATIEPTAS